MAPGLCTTPARSPSLGWPAIMPFALALAARASPAQHVNSTPANTQKTATAAWLADRLVVAQHVCPLPRPCLLRRRRKRSAQSQP